MVAAGGRAGWFAYFAVSLACPGLGKRVVGEIKSGKVDFKVDKAGIIHAMVGKVSFGADKLVANIMAFVDKIIQLKPSAAKGVYLKGVTISTTMGPGYKLDTMELRTLAKKAA